jgi:hypothetical protein
MYKIRITNIYEITQRGRYHLYKLKGDVSKYAGDFTRFRYRYIWNRGQCAFCVGTRMLEQQWNRMVSTKSVALLEHRKEKEFNANNTVELYS